MKSDSAPKRFAQFNQTALAMDAAANGQGIALAPKLPIHADLEQGRLVELWQDSRTNQGGYYVVYPLKQASNNTRDALIEWFVSEIK